MLEKTRAPRSKETVVGALEIVRRKEEANTVQPQKTVREFSAIRSWQSE